MARNGVCVQEKGVLLDARGFVCERFIGCGIIMETMVRHTVLHGDCFEMMKGLGLDEDVDFVVTDPPYFLDGLDEKWSKGSKCDSTGTIRGLPVGMKFDPKHGRKLERFMRAFGESVIKVMKPGAFAAVFSQPRLVHRLATGLEDAGFEVRDMFAWHFTNKAQFKAFSMDHFVKKADIGEGEKERILASLAGRKTPQLRPQFESIVLLQKPKQGTHVCNWMLHKTGLIDAKASLDDMSPTTVMKVEKPDKEKFNTHLTVKPVPLIRHLIELFTLPGQVVLDPFLGSGTTAVACMEAKRECIGIEIDAEYVLIARRRLEERNA